MKKTGQRILSGLLAVLMVLETAPVIGFAADDGDAALCPHHPAHTAECGYRAPTEEQPCTHLHTEECYEVVAECVHTHTEDCFPETETPAPPPETDAPGSSAPDLPAESAPAEGTEDPSSPETPSVDEPAADVPQPAAAGPTACTHICTEEEGCLAKVLHCTHTHDGSCGYAPAQPGQACGFVCTLCTGETPEEGAGGEPSEPWPEAPDWVDDPSRLPAEEGGIYAAPEQPFSAAQLSMLRADSQTAKVVLDPDKRIPTGLPGEAGDEVSEITFLYINGEAYTGGDLTLTVGDNFSYIHTWSPRLPDGKMTWEEGSWFELELFRVPGLNLPKTITSTLLINGIKVGESTRSYDPVSGVMTYQVVFSRYIQFFLPETIMAGLQGSGKFSSQLENAPIELGGKTGVLTVVPRPELPQPPTKPSGQGWKPGTAPVFRDKLYSFGKGLKWHSSYNDAGEPQIEWRVVFLEQLQKTQQSFLQGEELTVSDGNLIVTETLGVNQRFYFPNPTGNAGGEEGKYQQNAPFFIELPVIAPGTGNILNAATGAGNDSYDGAGIIEPIITGAQFREIDGSKAVTAEQITEIHNDVKSTPLSWTLTIDPETRQQTLLINLGELGTTDPARGLTWNLAERNEKWPMEELERLIAECDAKIEAFETGADSPISLLDSRQDTLHSLLLRAVNLLPAEAHDEANAEIEAWDENYQTWRTDPRVRPLAQLVDPNLPPDLQTPIVPLPDLALVTGFESWPVNNNGRFIDDTQEYQDYIASIENLLGDQSIYLENRMTYGDSWANAKEFYQKTLQFYSEGRVYGFVLKLRTRSINTSATTYQNNVRFELGKKQWNAEDSAEITYSSSIVGHYALGDLVLQKADALYDTGDTIGDIQTAEKEKAGEAVQGALFKVYCGKTEGVVPPIDEKSLAHFLDKAASANGETYIYTHTGDDDHLGMLHGEVSELAPDADGKIALGSLSPMHEHWLVEIAAPRGYYFDDTPIRMQSEIEGVVYDLIPNVSRSVLLYKRDSFSKLPVAGAEFALCKVENGQPQPPLTGFTEKTINGHTTYIYDGTGTAALRTNADGELCIHGLDAGSYLLKELRAAPGYILPDASAIEEFSFTLSEGLPTLDENRQDAQGHTYDAKYHLLLNTAETALENEPMTADLTLKKQGEGNAPLAGAGFALFRFNGTEADWEAGPDNEEMWVSIDLDPADSKYFQTEQQVEEVSAGENGWNGSDELPVVFTGADGKFTLTEIPVGHYSISELKAPATYKRDYRSFYFTINGETVGTSVQLYTNPEQTSPLAGNTLKNYQELAKIAIVKYDAAGPVPVIDGAPLVESTRPAEREWYYTDKVLADVQEEGYQGLQATYKLFMRRGASGDSRINPSPVDLLNAGWVDYDPQFDLCVAIGTTDANGVLRLTEMKGRNDKPIEGLNPENYYLIEVKAPDGYLLDQTPIYFALDEHAFAPHPDGSPNKTPGFVKIASNRKLDYGLRVQKVDAASMGEGQTPVGLPGAAFEVREQGSDTPLRFRLLPDGAYRVAAAGETAGYSDVETREDGMLKIVGLKPGTAYTLTETRAPLGYKLPPQLQDRQTTITTPSQSDGFLEGGNLLFPYAVTRVQNTRRLGVMTLHKQDAETGEALEGAVFELYKVETRELQPGEPGYDPDRPGLTTSTETLIAKQTTDENGDLRFENLEWHSHYFVQELTPPPGYMLNAARGNFSIDENSFDANGDPIPVVFPAVSNTRGVLGAAVLHKVDAADHSKRLPGAHFFLERQVGLTADQKEIWVGYGQGIYTTDDQDPDDGVDTAGEIRFYLPPGDYRLTEMKAPTGYVLEGMKMQHFTIPQNPDPDNPVRIGDTESDVDGSPVVTNRKGDTGVRIFKKLGASDSPIPGVTFRVGWELFSLDGIRYEPLSFIPVDGVYEYIDDPKAPGATTDLVTNTDGMIYANLPADLLYDGGELASLVCWEVDAPDGLVVDSTPKPFKLTEGIYAEVNVPNSVTQEVTEQLAITLHKTDGESGAALAGAEYDLYWYLGNGETTEGSHILLAHGVTDARGTLVFTNTAVDFPGLMAGETYHIVETAPPHGYVLDETHHEITLDSNCFDEDFRFTGAELHLPNYRISGSVRLTKVDAADASKGLAGAEFELLHRPGSDDPLTDQWEHYGAHRYVTDENGVLLIEDLPYGSYLLVERAAPLGYELAKVALPFTIEENGRLIELGAVANRKDPRPVRDVSVQKVAAHDPAQALAGAEFQLYEKADDGSYHLRHAKVYTTDAAGRFTIAGLPAGNYALREIKAPEGYELPAADMTYFAVTEQDAEVSLSIRNARIGTGTGGGGSDSSDAADLLVHKVDGEGDRILRTASFIVYRKAGERTLYRTVSGSGWSEDRDDAWTYYTRDGSFTAHDLKPGTYYIEEVKAPDGYTRAEEPLTVKVGNWDMEVEFENRRSRPPVAKPNPPTGR